MSKPFPEEIEPLRLAQAGRELVGRIPLASMVRLATLLDTRVIHNVEGGENTGTTDVDASADADIDSVNDNVSSDQDGNRDEPTVNVALRFDLDEAGQAYIAGSVEAQVQLQCQRCMQPMNYTISEKVSLGIVLSEQQAEQLPEYYEPLLLLDSVMAVSDVIEDELMLGLPTVALHSKGQCAASGQLSVEASAEELSKKIADNSQIKPNPFAALSQLKSTLKQKTKKNS